MLQFRTRIRLVLRSSSPKGIPTTIQQVLNSSNNTILISLMHITLSTTRMSIYIVMLVSWERVIQILIAKNSSISFNFLDYGQQYNPNSQKPEIQSTYRPVTTPTTTTPAPQREVYGSQKPSYRPVTYEYDDSLNGQVINGNESGITGMRTNIF